MEEAQIYDPETNQYHTVTWIQMQDNHNSLEWSHKFFPWNWKTFRINGFSFDIPESFQSKDASLDEVVAFIIREWRSTNIVAFGVTRRIGFVMDSAQN